MSNILSDFFSPPKAKPLLPENKIASTYKKMRLKVFLGAFFGYAGYYLVRKNMALASPEMQKSVAEGGLGLDYAQIGFAMSGISIAYAFSKFLMGSLSDRSDSRKFLVIGLILSALVMMSVGIFPFATSSVAVMFLFMLVIGWLSGMGWPPCGRIMVHWFSQNERSFKMSIWNTSHTIGSGALGNLATVGMVLMAGICTVTLTNGSEVSQAWRGAFIFPSAVAVVIALFCWWAIRDTPQSCGLPPIDEYRKDFSAKKTKNDEEKIPFKTLFVEYVFKNKVLWLIALANAFVYLVRYGAGDWSVTYLCTTLGFSQEQGNLAFSLHNYAGVPGTIICGWISSKYFKGRCAPANVIYMALVLLGIILYWKATSIATLLSSAFGTDFHTILHTIVYCALIFVGFCIYGPVALIGVQAVNLVPKNAAGTAAGFVGLFGYLIGDAILAKITMGSIVDHMGWNASFWLMIIASILALIFCATTWKKEMQESKTER